MRVLQEGHDVVRPPVARMEVENGELVISRRLVRSACEMQWSSGTARGDITVSRDALDSVSGTGGAPKT